MIELGLRSHPVDTGVESAKPAVVDEADPLSLFGSESEPDLGAGVPHLVTFRFNVERSTAAVSPGGAVPAPTSEAPQVSAHAPSTEPKIEHVQSRRYRWLVPVLLAAAALAQAPLTLSSALQAPIPSVGGLGLVDVGTEPAGVEVWVEGRRSGRTPVRVSLEPGQHTIELRHAGLVRAVPVTVASGETVRYHMAFSSYPAMASLALAGGTLVVVTDPPGAVVSVDGVVADASPVTLTGLPAGTHLVSVAVAGTAVEREVRVDAGATASLVFTTLPQSESDPARATARRDQLPATALMEATVEATELSQREPGL